ncbi:MFS transporter [Pedobacter heparinus]|uniref:Major facilitator superfamily MFS_1 n=1 Tax=Pedobacter heparinus (strain ATCC 13125 / DSM 2366 / CIP 104194 / JCM 7457 / NBRC 12017 / NCIMB 9290 / NRRL B-14731 / HIM 762-3) TaxID=485917 RepID=C6XZ52_PEDHD|nr:MFS transporter [Pedobacter heparinus]ACU02534.1 major facilitator superfamily MFS_1 [Pedobacter heparinus DSM 2366]
MKKKLLLVVIYLAFVSLGLPDSLLGPAWPAMFRDLHVPIHFAGILFMIIAGGTVISSLFSGRIIDHFGVAAVTTFSVLMTAIALLGFSQSQHFIYLCLLAIPLGLGAGCVDAALNNYVALHYKAKHMNWLHCFWGIGAAIGPIIMSKYLALGGSWSEGYLSVGWIQIVLVVILFISTPLWIKNIEENPTKEGIVSKLSFKKLISIPGLKQALIVFFCYCTIEATFGLWGASYLVFIRNFEPEEAAKLVSLYYAGITIGRFVSGFMTERISNRQLVYTGQAIIALGLIIIFLPFKNALLPGFFLVGLGCAPIFPGLLHETPRNFGEKYSQSIMGIQMASAYIGIMLMPLLFGELAGHVGYGFLLWFIVMVLIIMFYMTNRLNKTVQNKENSIIDR